MSDLTKLLSNEYLWCSFFTWCVAQSFKFVKNWFKNRQWDVRSLLGSSGMPSSHTASVMALTTMVGLKDGFDSALFAACMVFSVVVMYDAMGVRRETGKQGYVINVLQNFIATGDPSIRTTDMKEKIGHSPFEVVMGAVTGILCAVLFQAV